VFKSIKVVAQPPKTALPVVAVWAEELKLPARLSMEARTRDALAAALRATANGFRAEAGETLLTADGRGLLIGLGKRGDLKPETLRTIGARLMRRLDRLAPKSIAISMGEAMDPKAIDHETAGRCVGEGLGLANWRMDLFTGTATRQKPAQPALGVSGGDARFRAGLERGLTLAEAANDARRIAATPPNICNPTWMAAEARRMARAAGRALSCRVIDFAQAKKLGMGGIVNVGIGSASKPCLIILDHRPAPRKVSPRARHITLALVGKTMTYDTGGYSLKVNNGMKGMKYDKCGGAAVFAAMRAIARLDLPIRVVGLLPCAENMVSDISYRPDDIITLYNGVSVEVTNTDAEGRLVLGDALAYACRDLGATHIVDLATLTGGIVTALGHFCAGVFCNDEKLLSRVSAAAESSGEKVWRMPLWKDHMEFMRAQHADILNSNPSRNAHPIQGAAFLAYFVDEKVPWAHLDIAGVGSVEKDTDLFVTGPTGWGTRLLIDLVESWT
jgi:leucyl aminopeptidase